jgi:hypothetical protein
LDGWNPGANALVKALAVSGSTVYVGGYFTSIGGQVRSRIAALDGTTGLATDWDPAAGGVVLTLALSGSTIYVGGYFTSIGGQERHSIAALDATTGLATTRNPSADYDVYALAVSGSTVYAGGVFTNIGGQARNRIAALDATTGLATAWDPNADLHVWALAVSGSTVYAGGDFHTIGGQDRGPLAALDATTGLATDWIVGAGCCLPSVYTLAISGSTVYVGGYFSQLGGSISGRGNNIAALDATTGDATSWDSGTNGPVYALAVNRLHDCDGSHITVPGHGSPVFGPSFPPRRNAARAPWCLAGGRSAPDSHRWIVTLPTPSRLPSAAWLRPSSRRRFRMKSPRVRGPTACALGGIQLRQRVRSKNVRGCPGPAVGGPLPPSSGRRSAVRRCSSTATILAVFHEPGVLLRRSQLPKEPASKPNRAANSSRNSPSRRRASRRRPGRSSPVGMSPWPRMASILGHRLARGRDRPRSQADTIRG